MDEDSLSTTFSAHTSTFVVKPFRSPSGSVKVQELALAVPVRARIAVRTAGDGMVKRIVGSC